VVVALVEIKIINPPYPTEDWAREQEVKLAIQALLEEHQMARTENALLLSLEPIQGEILFRLECQEQGLISTMILPMAILKPHLESYRSICLQMSQEPSLLAAPSIEALDMAKKLTHDDAARALAGYCSSLRADHATLRRVFTLLFTIYVDSQNLNLLHLPHH
jgi:uncharacterized protein (UPF0262 family)